MALVAERTTLGFEPLFNIMTGCVPPPNEWELTPNTAFSIGDMVVLTNGKIAKAAAGATNVVGVMAQSFTTSTNPSAARTFGRVYDNPFNVYQCTFSDYVDSTATSGTTTTLVDTTLSTSTDNDWRGALVYVYAGTNAGILTTVKTYTGATDTLIFEETMPAAFDTTSKYIMLGLGAVANNNVINFGTVGVDLKTASTIDANATIASEAGPLAVYPGGPNAADYIKNLMLRVMIRKPLLGSA